jgi:Resolvase, N terminal domain
VPTDRPEDIAVIQLPVPAVGYVRSPYPDTPKRDEHVDAIVSYAHTHTMRLVCVYRDDGMPSAGVRRSGFTQVLHQLAAGHVMAVIVPAAHHLSWHPDLRAHLIGLIHHAGGQLHIVQMFHPETEVAAASPG